MKQFFLSLIGLGLLLFWWGYPQFKAAPVPIPPSTVPQYVTSKATPTASADSREPNSSTKIDAPVALATPEPLPTAITAADLHLSIEPEHPFAVRGERFVWNIDIKNQAPIKAHHLTLRIQIPTELIDIRLERQGWTCDYTAVAKSIFCQLPQLDAQTTGSIRLNGRLPQTTTTEQFHLIAQVESAQPDPNWQNNTAMQNILIDELRYITPPSGHLFAHLVQPELASDSHADYPSEQWITALLQAPIQIGIGYQEEIRPYLCTTHACPESERIYGRVLQESYTIQSITRLNETVPLEIGRNIDEAIPIYRYVASHPSDCPQHPCIGYGWGESSIFAWSTADLVTLYTFTEGGRPVNCQQNCLAINSAEPGYYTIKTAVTLAATFPDYPHITNSYTLEGVFYLKLIAPFLNGNQPTN